MFKTLPTLIGLLTVVFLVSTLAVVDAKVNRKLAPQTPISCFTVEQLREYVDPSAESVRYNCEPQKETIREAIKAMENSHIYYNDEEQNGFLVRFPGELIFSQGSAELSLDAMHTLHRFAKIAHKYHNSITVNGHASTPDIHTTQYPSNQELSKARADRVTNHLIYNQGIDDNRLSSRGFGEESPYNVEIDEATERLNRRVDFFVHN